MEFYKLFNKYLEDEVQKRVWISESGYVYACSFKNGYIAERLTLERVRQWNSCTPVMISAQTGAGKTTFILSILLPVMKERKKRMVVLCSRSVLAQQIKRAAAKLELSDIPDELIDVYIKYRSNFGAIDVYTYQEVTLRFQNTQFVRDFQYYGAVVCDECHFFIQDAEFNQYTERVFQSIQRFAHRAVRVYLTATPDPVVDMIADSEYKNYKKSLAKYTRCKKEMLTPRFLFYTFTRNYEYVNPFFFRAWDTLIEEIDKHSPDEKWLIFVSRKEDGETLQGLLRDKRALFIDAELKNGEKAEEIKKMVAEKQFQPKILIVTKFLDVGVDLWDSQLRNVVLSTLDKTTFIQALGRKRVKSGEFVNTFIRIPNIKELTKRKQAYCLQIKDLYEYIQESRKDGYLANEISFPFYLENSGSSCSILYNKFTPIAYKQQIEAMDKFLENIEIETISKRFLSWLGIEHKYQKERWLDSRMDQTIKEIEEVMLPWIGKDLSSLEYNAFCQSITNYVKTHSPDMLDPHSERIMKTKKIRDFLKSVGIVYVIKNSKTGIHRIERG